jgi:hypothetical protein
MGESLDMKVSLIRAVENWEKLTARRVGGTSAVSVSCPVTFDARNIHETMGLMGVQRKADRLLQLFQIGSHIQLGGKAVDGCYKKAMRYCREALKGELEDAETDEERANIRAHWPFQDHDEDEYE